MQYLRLFVFVAPLALASNVTPVQKVIDMMEDMKEKGTKEMKEEQVQFAEFSQFCELTLADKARSIGDATDKIETLEAEIAQAGSEAERLGAEAAQHAAEAKAAQEEKTEATEVRSKERADFQTTHQDYTESIDAIGRAMKALKEKKEVSLAQLAATRTRVSRMPTEVADQIDALLATAKEEPSLLAEGVGSQAPKPKTYEFQSGGVISMLESLQDKFVDERNTLETEEQAKKHAYELLAQRLEAQSVQSDKEEQEKTQFKAKKMQTKASSTAELEETKAEKESDVKYSTDLKATCDKKASAFKVRQQTRKEELEAISKAQEIISGGAVSGNAKKHLPSLLQQKAVTTVTALAFLRSEHAETGQRGQRGQDQVARFLQQKATQLDSRMLSALAVRVAADPLAKVKTMIEQLVVKLNEQGKAEATKQAWCETELSTTKQTQDTKSDGVESLTAEMDQLKASIAKLGDETTTLATELSELEAAMTKAADLRTKEKEKNAVTIKEAKEAQEAVAQALQVLKEFYAKASDATALVQTKERAQRAQPEVFGDEPYTGMGGESGGVIGMMEVIESDFARLEAETTSGEEASKKDDDSVAAKLAARYAAAASLAQRQSDVEALFSSSPLSPRFAGPWAAAGSCFTPETPEQRKTPRVKPMGRENGGHGPTTPSEAAKEVFATRLRERTPSNRLQLRMSRTARPEARPEATSRRHQRSASPVTRPKSFRLISSQRSTGSCVSISEPLPRWPSLELPSTSPRDPREEDSTPGSGSSLPAANSAAVAAAISAAATAVWHAAEQEAEQIKQHKAVSGYAVEVATPSPESLQSLQSPSPGGLQRSQSATSPASAKIAPAQVRSPSASRLLEVRPGSITVPVVPVVPAVPRSFYTGPLVPVACPGAQISRSPSPGAVPVPLAMIETATPRARYVSSPSVIVRRSTSPLCSPAGSMTVGPPEKSMAALAWAAAGRRVLGGVRSASAVPARGYGIPMAPRVEPGNSRQRGLDMSDPTDLALFEALRRVDTLTTARLEVQKLGPGRYRIDGRQVQLRAKGASPRHAHQELLIHEEEASGVLKEGLDLSFYLSQAANVAAALRVSAVGRIPQELRLTFGNNDSKGPGVEDVSPRQRQRCMRQAVAEAAQRSQAAEVLEQQLGRQATSRSRPEPNFTKATMLSL